jgi:REP element-mobilizing transposase RayT
MTTRAFSFAVDEFYHVYNRGVEKRIIYQDLQDYKRFLELLYVANTSGPTDLRQIRSKHDNVYDWERDEPLVAIGAYCLMPNHFHILLTPLQEAGVSIFMNKVCTSYSMYFNKKYQRSGTLFEGKFKAKHVATDEYLKYLFSYIHLNPVKLIQSDWKEQGITDSAKAYAYASAFKHSSLLDYLQPPRIESALLKKDSFPDYFPSAAKQKEELIQWLRYTEE